MKRRVGTFKGKPIVVGDPNLITSNEIDATKETICDHFELLG